ncbi:MAG TPA: hypothetical protein DEG42_04240 [Acholeplasmataceae bacterium]|nr:MAG: hypothetical protein A2Y43_03595 [Tenericutes bacterium GWA2_38_26]OHE30557.1 MAG: hypothetical protein A2084_01015 [Tenericutes bacterium GWC2_39_45]OHE32146.1 MAG: hypothetical protein A2009_03215 [Tenericutes bacterium GWD2_38_27]OHE37506.1 MAG: hypothetical protein A2013_00305 [Tenericutes bacterium GWE2_38_8]HBG32485.1 hypothetical protein [Acholeplasmataceae bacterium]
MKGKYLEDLREILEEYEANKAEIDDIINDYAQLYDDAKANGKSDEEIYQILGKPDEVVDDLMDSLKFKRHKDKGNKIVALMPFISVITYMILGFVYNLWNPGWIVFLSIPMVAIIANTRFKNAIVALSPFLSVIAFLILGFEFQLWHPGWMVFLFIPMSAIILNTRLKDMFVAISPFVATIIFIVLGFYYDLWNPGWLVFLMIPMIGVLYKPNKLHVFLYELSFIVAIGFYLYMGYVYELWAYGGLGFLLPFGIGILLGDVKFELDAIEGPQKNKVIVMLLTIFFCIAAFLTLGFVLDGWIYAWQVFLLIPVVAILAFDKFRFTAIAPFVAVVLFFSIGYFFDMFHISWLAFMIIPIAAILENA